MSRPWIRGCLLSQVLAFFFATNLYAQTNFVYTNDDVSGQNTVSGFAVAENDGALTRVPGSPFLTGGTGSTGGGLLAVNRATTCSAQKLIYVSNAGSNDVSGFSVDPSTGSLALVPGSPFRTGGSGPGGIALACTPDGRFLMAANSGSGGSSDIIVFSIADGGALTPGVLTLVGSRSIDFPPEGIKISPDGKFLAAALPIINAVAMFSIAPDNGTLTPVPDSPFLGASADGALAGVDINCASTVMFGVARTTIVDVFDIATNGALTPRSPFTPGVGVSSGVVLLSPNERLLFVSNQSKSVTVASVAPNASLSLVTGSPFAAPGSNLPSGMAMDQAGNFLYVADGGKVYGYTVANNGVLAPVPGSPFLPNPPASRVLSLTAFPGKTCNQPPDCSAAIASPSTVWPPTGEMVPISLSGVTDPDGDPVTITATSVSNSEQRYRGCSGDATCSPLAVRAERDGDGDGRVYKIQFTASDGRGGACTGEVNVCVPHDQGHDSPCGDGDDD